MADLALDSMGTWLHGFHSIVENTFDTCVSDPLDSSSKVYILEDSNSITISLDDPVSSFSLTSENPYMDSM